MKKTSSLLTIITILLVFTLLSCGKGNKFAASPAVTDPQTEEAKKFMAEISPTLYDKPLFQFVVTGSNPDHFWFNEIGIMPEKDFESNGPNVLKDVYVFSMQRDPRGFNTYEVSGDFEVDRVVKDTATTLLSSVDPFLALSNPDSIYTETVHIDALSLAVDASVGDTIWCAVGQVSATEKTGKLPGLYFYCLKSKTPAPAEETFKLDKEQNFTKNKN